MTKHQGPRPASSSLVIGHWKWIAHWDLDLVIGASRSLRLVRHKFLRDLVGQRADRADVERLVVAGDLALFAALFGEAGGDAVLLVRDVRLLRGRVDLDDLDGRDRGAAEHLRREVRAR